MIGFAVLVFGALVAMVVSTLFSAMRGVDDVARAENSKK